MYAVLTKSAITETIRLQRIRCFGHVQRIEENTILKRVSYMNLETRSRNRWQDEVREDERIVGGEEWQKKKVYDGEK
jgi:hypothetical protein